MVVDEEDVPGVADGQVGGLPGFGGEGLDGITTDADQHPAPVVLPRQPPHGRSEHIVLPPVGIGQEPATFEGIGQAEDTAGVDAKDLRQMGERYRLRPTSRRLPGPRAPVPRSARAASPVLLFLIWGASPPSPPHALRSRGPHDPRSARAARSLLLARVFWSTFIWLAARATRSAPSPRCPCSSALP